MTLDDLRILSDPSAMRLLDELEGEIPTEVALRYREHEIPGRLLATQIELRQRARKKVPSWAEAGCLFTRRALEQATPEAILPRKPISGAGFAIDLTGGLGVDVWKMGQHFDRVLYNDADPVLVALARYNFSRLGLYNIEFSNVRAEALLADETLPIPELLYVDPDRRDEGGGRKLLLENYSPDLTRLIPAYLERLAAEQNLRMVIKVSPLLDLTALRRTFAEMGLEVGLQVRSLVNEVKEVLIEFRTGGEVEKPDELVLHMFRREMEYRIERFPESQVDTEYDPLAGELEYVLEPDAAAYQAQIIPRFLRRYGRDIVMNHPMGYGFTPRPPQFFPGRIFRIVEKQVFRPKSIKKMLKENAVRQLNISRRNFDLSVADVRKKLSVAEGGDLYLLITKNQADDRLVFLCERIQ